MLTKLIHGAVFVFLLITFVMAQGGGYALDFDGVNDYVSVGGSDISKPCTVEAWTKKTSNSGYGTLLSGGSYRVRLDQWSTSNKVGFTKTGTYDASFNKSTTLNEWVYVAIVFTSDSSTLYINGAYHSKNNQTNFKIPTDLIGTGGSSTITATIDELRIWSVARTAAQIAENIHVELDGDETGLVAYFKMSNGSGTTLTDNSSNSNDGTLTNMVTSGGSSDWITSNAPIGDLTSGYTTDVEALWEGCGTSASDASDGLTMVVGTALTDANFAVFGNNNTAGTSTADLPSGVEVRSERIWYVDESNTVAADVTIDISDATGYTVTAGTVSDYKLLNRAGTSGDFSILASGSSKTGDAVTFSSVTLSDEYLAIGQATDSDAYLSAHVTISGSSNHFRMMSSPVDGTVYDDILAPLWIQGMTNGDVTSGTANVWTYDGADAEWDALTNLNTASQVAGEGFLVYVFTDTDFDGDDDLPVILSVSGTENSGNVDHGDGSIANNAWTFAGNPYASTIDWDLVTQTNVTTSAYVWDSQASTPAYISWNGSSGSLSNGLIAPYQGFWIQGSGGSGSITIAEADKSGTAGTFYKTMNDSTGSMSFAISSGEDYEDNAFVSFMTNGETGMDNSDAYKLLPMTASERVVGISYAEGNGLDINNLPYIHDGSLSMPLDIMYLTLDSDYNFVTNENDVTMSWDLSSLPGHISMTLTDNISGDVIDLTQQSEVTFTTVEKGSFPAYGSGGVNIYPEVGESQFTLTIQYSALSTNDDSTFPTEFALHQAYPNPFNPSTTISFVVPLDAKHITQLRVYNINGQLIETLVNERMEPGSHTIQWNPVNLSSGVYIVQMKARDKTFNQKITFIK